MNPPTPWLQLKEAALDLLFPRWCVGCGREGELLCASCQASLPLLTGPLCPKCGQPLIHALDCLPCQEWPLAIDSIRSPFRFEGVIRKAIHQFKYQGLKALAQPLAELLDENWRARPSACDVVVPVPLHPRRQRQRGYNHAGLLARKLEGLIGLPVVEGCLLRRRDTAPQARTAGAEERRANVAEVFLCRDQRLEGKRILLIDDVCTTGATLDACARALRSAGAASVWGLTLAREI
ncbi:MAG: double zinc ribbon domain-containing protein [Dehalococcoidia bacterium]